jgi:endonuclease/exonuclease/phosphatase family metal-dependent hydrolase
MPKSAQKTITVATYNIHKGLSHFNRRIILDEVREGLREMHADIVFLQEVQGERLRPTRARAGQPQSHSVAQHEYLGEGGFEEVVYGQNATYDSGHHGNAVMSRHRVLDWENIDVSHHALESRGLLHCRVQVPGWAPLHCVCVHLGLLARSRTFQLARLCERIEAHVPHDEPLIIAGDFNDWRRQASKLLARELEMHEAFEQMEGTPARTYPASLPVLSLDRIYVRRLSVKSAQCLDKGVWAKLSDHAALIAVLAQA